MRRIISILLQNEAGALARVAGMFSARGYNIDSLTVAATHVASVSRLTLVTAGDDVVIAQIIQQSRKLVDVIEIADLTGRAHLERELLMVTVDAPSTKSAGIAACVRQHAGAEIVDEADVSRTIQFVGTGAELNAFLSALAAVTSIRALARSGTAALDCGVRELSEAAA